MNRIVKLFVLGVLLTANMQAQTVEQGVENEILIQADTVQISFENKLRPAIAYTSDVGLKDVKKHWKSFLTRTYKISSKSKGANLMTSKDVVIHSLSDKRMNLYASIEENGAGSKIKFFGAFGYDIYIDAKSYEAEFASLIKIAENFLYESTTIFYNEKTNGFSKQLASLTTKNSNLLKEIQKDNANIELGKATVATLSEVEDDGSKAFIKAKKKILKLKNKEAIYTAEIEENKKQIAVNEEKIKLLKKDVAYYTDRKELLKR